MSSWTARKSEGGPTPTQNQQPAVYLKGHINSSGARSIIEISEDDGSGNEFDLKDPVLDASGDKSSGPSNTIRGQEDVNEEEDSRTFKCTCEESKRRGALVFCRYCGTWQHIQCSYPSRIGTHSCHECRWRRDKDDRAIVGDWKRPLEVGLVCPNPPTSIPYPDDSADFHIYSFSNPPITPNTTIIRYKLATRNSYAGEASPEALSKVSQASVKTPPPTFQHRDQRPDLKTQEKRLFGRHLVYLAAVGPIPQNTPILPLTGVVLSQSDFLKNQEGQTLTLGILPYVFLNPVHPRYLIDARNQSTVARYIRFSCTPNSRLQAYRTDWNQADRTPEYDYWIVSDQLIRPRSIITIPWQFIRLGSPAVDEAEQDSLLIHRVLSLEIPILHPETYQGLSQLIYDLLSEHGGCACNLGIRCKIALFHKKYLNQWGIWVHRPGFKGKDSRTGPDLSEFNPEIRLASFGEDSEDLKSVVQALRSAGQKKAEPDLHPIEEEPLQSVPTIRGSKSETTKEDPPIVVQVWQRARTIPVEPNVPTIGEDEQHSGPRKQDSEADATGSSVPHVGNEDQQDSMRTAQGSQGGPVTAEVFDYPTVEDKQYSMQTADGSQADTSVGEAPLSKAFTAHLSVVTQKDSGYGSRETGTVLDHATEGFQNTVSGFRDHETMSTVTEAYNTRDTQTLYSDTQSLRNSAFSLYKDAFVEELSRDLSETTVEASADVESLLPILLSLLQAFAVRLCHESPGPLERQMVFLVHRFRTELSVRLLKSFQGDTRDFATARLTDEEEDTTRNPDPDMSVNDKMLMWQANSQHHEDDTANADERLNQLDQISGPQVEEDAEWEEYDAPSLPQYREALAKAPAYRWLRSSIATKMALEIPNAESDRPSIGSQIISAVGRPAKFSRSQTQELRMQFEVDWDPFEFVREQEYNQPLSYVLAHAITLTGHGNNLQAITCAGYMQQTWPDTGPQLLAFLRKLTDTPSEYCKESLPGKTVLTAQLEHSKLHILMTGNVFSIAEIADQLGWLGAALRSSSDATAPMYSTAYVADLKVNSSYRTDTDVSGYCRIAFRLEKVEDVDSTEKGGCWYGMFRNPVIVRHYPIPRRPKLETDSGLEIPLEMVAELTNCRRIVKFADIPFIKGFAAMLAAVRVVGDIVFWHLVYNAKGDYVSYEDERVPPSSGIASSLKELQLGALQQSRHIVGWTDNVQNLAGAPDADYRIQWTNLPRPHSKCVLEKVTISADAFPFIKPGAQIAVGIKDKPLHLGFGSGEDYMGNLMAICRKYFIFYDTEERRAWLVDGASAVLHLLRAYLKFSIEDDLFSEYFMYSDGDIEEAVSAVAYTGARAAFKVLANSKNQNLPLYPKTSEKQEETTATLGTMLDERVTVFKETHTHFTLKERVEQLCHVLRQMTAYHDDLNTQAGYGYRIKKSPRHRIEGFDFMDVATKQDTLWPKVATLHAKSVGWVDFARALRAVPLFGVGFGDLLRPVTRTDGPCCASTSPVPTGSDFLAVYGADLEAILRRGSKSARSKVLWRLVDNVHWHSPDGVAFESCRCTGTDSTNLDNTSMEPHKPGSEAAGKQSATGLSALFKNLGSKLSNKSEGKAVSDRVQVLLPTNFPQLYGRGLRSPGKIVAKGAVIFGHCAMFPLRWSLTRDDVPPEEGEPDTASLDDVSSLMTDSALGASIRSTSSAEEKKPTSATGSSSLYGLGKNPHLRLPDEDSGFASEMGNVSKSSILDGEDNSDAADEATLNDNGTDTQFLAPQWTATGSRKRSVSASSGTEDEQERSDRSLRRVRQRISD
ncbi:hypothetical protein QBC35DRAFT_505834 [Podospora australis]|uniref:Zinc finger PHD-type domain-containing protein n=1 Tax=Podospora australis TaxID=1536484 RepID=A0AAN6WMS1_9PEZI|nr:hypothetical protein QBC35DRAFT_505834 [Podospora australis]